MADIKSPEERSRNMAKIRSKDTKPEEYIRKLLHAHGYRYRKNVNYIPGHPDLWIARYNTAVFVNGCFWHRHEGCKYSYIPKTRLQFWLDKFDKNVKRDSFVREELEKRGIRILIIWECTIKNMIRTEKKQKEIYGKIDLFLKSEETAFEV